MGAILATEHYHSRAEEIRYLAASYDATTLSRRLGFSPPLETEFRHFFARRYNANRLQALILIVLLFFFSAAIDFFNSAATWGKTSLFKYSIGLVIIAVFALVVSSRLFLNNAQKISWLAFMSLLLSLLLGAQLGGKPSFELYLPIILVLILGAGLLTRLLLLELATLLLFILLAINAALLFNHVTNQLWAAFNIYCTVAGILALFLSYFFERAARKRFIKQHIIELEHNHLLALSEELSSLANIDSVTGLGNYKHLSKSLEMEWYRAIRNQKPLSLLSVDIDYYSNIVQTNGEKMALDSLVAIAKCLEHTFKRAADMVARYKQDGFLVLLPETSSANATVLASAACANVRQLQLSYGVDSMVTISIGQVSVEPQEDQEMDTIIKKADAALYLAKRNGRDGYYVYNDE